MASILLTLWQWRRVAVVATFVAILATFAWRATVWHDSHERLQAIEAQLQAERACEPLTACQQRAEEQARLARQKAEEAAQSALESALAAESKARADAAAWRAKYRAALQENPECADWSQQPVRCPL